MAIAAATVFEARTTGSDNNSGGFVTGATGTDFSQQNSPQYALTGITSAGAGNVILTATAANDMVGNLIHVISGTNYTTGLAAFFEILSVVVGVSITCGTNIAGASISTGVGVNGVMNIGGALKLDSAGIDTILENSVPGNIWYIKGGSYTINGSISLTAVGTNALFIKFYGYGTVRGDNPLPNSGNQPVLAFGANSWVSNVFWDIRFCELTTTGTGATFLNLSTGAQVVLCKVNNTSATAGRSAIGLTGNASLVSNCDVACTNGNAIATSQFNTVIGCYIHSSDVGYITTSATGTPLITDCVIANITTAAVRNSSGASGFLSVIGNTLYGAATPTGSSVGVSITAAGPNLKLINNIIYGFVTGLSNSSSLNLYSANNNFYNNTTDRVNQAAGITDIALDPQFTNASGGDFSVGANMKYGAMPSLFFGSNTTNYRDIGAAQRAGGVSTNPGAGNVIVGAGTFLIDDVVITPTYVVVTPANVRNATNFGAASAQTGTLVVPTAANVRFEVVFDNGTEGTLVVPIAADVRLDIVFDNGTEGTLVVPDNSEVEDGVIFDNGTEGTLISAKFLWDQLTIDTTTPGSIGKLIVDNIDAKVSETLTMKKYVGLK